MQTFTAIVERDSETHLYVGYVPGFPGAHSQGETLDELQDNLREVLEMLLEDEEVLFETEFIGTPRGSGAFPPRSKETGRKSDSCGFSRRVVELSCNLVAPTIYVTIHS
ncbi:type II toxin-antitoxin system HicB family antitoxin [Geitlerinema sp. P-1104]|nr:type II toxin-antitoxin system HicB family antitoxin [Geitlerinema sp. P-1104]NMG60818.1 type II toxin-antitoxin system HicB family antitoxin [Geitlerinema sp. P-1104]